MRQYASEIDSLVKRGLIETSGKYSLGCQLVKLVEIADETKAEEPENKEEEEIMNTTTTNTVTYRGKQVPVYGGAWNDSMNSCFYDVIGSIKGYDICRSTADMTVFALSNPMAKDDVVELTHPVTFQREGGREPITIIRAEYDAPSGKWSLIDADHVRWYRYPQWDEDGKLAYYMPDSVKGQRILMTQQELDNITTNNEEEETTMKTTNTSNPVTLDLVGGIVRFELNGTTYTYNIESKRYAKITPDGKTKRIGKAEYEAAKVEYDQQVLDGQPSRVEVENDLEKPAVLNEHGCVDCSKCNVEKCVHRDCMRRNPRNVGGLGECPRLDNGIVSEAQKVAEETGMELAEAELAVNVQNEQKKPRKARKSKDIAYEGHGVTLTAKQVDFLLDLKMTDQWDSVESSFWTDVICDEIEGQFAGKPMTVGAMISTLCEKGIAERFKGEFTDPVTGRTRKSTYMELTPKGWEIAKELGL